MCDVRPFRGLRYNLQRITDTSSVITPPYDVISPEERTQFHHKSPFNIIRLEYGEEYPDDSPDNNKYTRAAATLGDWLRDGILVKEKQPAFYVIEHCFSFQEVDYSRWGLIARVRLEEFASNLIRPHESTARGPAIDRLHLLRSCRTNISPVMGLLHTDSGEMSACMSRLKSKAPDVSTTASNSETCNLWVVTSESLITEISQLLRDKVIYIADGHHRYGTALYYRHEQSESSHSHTYDEPSNFVMMSLMDSHDSAIVMLPTHRLVHEIETQRIAQLEETISPYFYTEELLPPLTSSPETTQSWLHTLNTRQNKGPVIGLYGLHGQNLCLLRLRDNADLQSLMTPDELKLWRDLDVVLLQRIILQAALGIATSEKEDEHVHYTRDWLVAKTEVDSGNSQLAFFLNPAPVSSILTTADAGKILPRKSTNFYPKTPAGLVMNPLWDDE